MLKKLVIILLCLAPLGGITLAQNDSGRQENLNYKVVMSGSCMEIHVSDTALFKNLDENTKQALIEKNAVKFSGVKTAVIRNGYNREIWIREQDSSFRYVLAKDIDQFQPTDFQRKTNAVYSKADFFSYYGTGMDFSSSHFTFNLAARFGCYFYKRLMDASVTYSFAVHSMNSNTFETMNIGVMYRAYPFYKVKAMQKLRLSPYAGGEISWAATFVDGERSDDLNLSVLIGVSWLIGPGSLDVGAQAVISNITTDTTGNFVATIGYSFCPALLFNIKHKKNK